MRAIRLTALLVVGLALLGLNVSLVSGQASGSNVVFVAAIHSDLKGANNYIASISGANNTVWNSYVLNGQHLSLYGTSAAALKPVPGFAADLYTPITKEGDFFVSTFKLVSGVKWSDGSDVTADDVTFTYNNMVKLLASGPAKGKALDVALGGGWVGLEMSKFIDHVDAVDSHTVKFFLKDKPGLAAWDYSILGAPILQKAYWAGKFEQAFAADDPVKTLTAPNTTDEPKAGAFLFKKWEPGAFAEDDKNPNFSYVGEVTTEFEGGGWLDVLPQNLGGGTRKSGDTTTKQVAKYTEGPFVDAVVYNLFGSSTASATALIKGDVDYVFNPLGYGKATLDQLDATAGVKVARNSDDGVFYMSFNMRKSPFNYLGFREAVQCVIDKEFVANQLLAGLVIPAYSPVPVGSAFWHRNLTDQEKQTACVGMSEADRQAQAKKYLTGDGFSFNSGGQLVDPNGAVVPQIELLHPNAAYDNNRNIFGEQIVNELQKLGVPMRDVPAGFNNIVTLVFDEQDFDMWQLGWSLSVLPSYLFDFFESSNTALGGNAAQGGVCSARENAANHCQDQYDQLAAALLKEQDINKAQQIAFQLQQAIFANVAYVPTHYVITTDAYHADRISWQGLEGLPLLGGLQFQQGLRDLAQKTSK
jgi:ABC-type transport system substrate-binding protein